MFFSSFLVKAIHDRALMISREERREERGGVN